jgi:PAS domain S-box-containing protein
VEDAIEESEFKFQSIVNSLPIGVHMYTLTDDDELIFSGYNPSADSILGVSHAQFLGKKILDAFPQLINTDIPARYKLAAREGIGWKTEQIDYQDRVINGAYEVYAFQSSPGKMVALFTDITSKLRSAEALHLSEEKFSKAFLTSPDSININRMSDGMYIDINQGFTNLTGYTREDAIGKTSLELNIWHDPADRARLVQGLRDRGFVENLEAKFRYKDGTVKTGLMSARILEINHEQCILSVTRDISERILAEEQLRKAHDNLEQAYDATLRGWVHTLELREHETAEHSRRVLELTAKMIGIMGFDGSEQVHILRGALLHDIGKLGVPDNILLKPGPLTQEEWAVMRCHPEHARELLSDIEYLRPSLDIPYSHHERWDGSGYPRGLAGKEIPLAARIFSVIDVYDALLSDRPYRPAWLEQDVLRYLADQKGYQFDPEVVERFLEIIK